MRLEQAGRPAKTGGYGQGEEEGARGRVP